jgi:RimJ/RimL family protein N-acetyltransferase
VTTSEPSDAPLVGTSVRLDPTTVRDAQALWRVLDDPKVWEFGYGGGAAARPANAAMMATNLHSWLAGSPRHRYPYTVRLMPSGDIVGTTSLLDLSLVDERVQLGGTAYSPAVWGSAVNPECKLLLLTYAFDACGLGRVQLQTDALNARSAAAITKTGGTFEGILRRHMRRADGSFRDTVVYSVLRQDWPRVKSRLTGRIANG